MSSDDAQAAFGETSPPRRSNRRLFFVLAAIDGTLAVVLAVVWFITGFTGLGDAVGDLTRIQAPGQAVAELEEGKQAVYWEGRGASPPLEIAVPLRVGMEHQHHRGRCRDVVDEIKSDLHEHGGTTFSSVPTLAR